jgi:oligoribonuclease
MSLAQVAKYAWIDLETTGLNPDSDTILEAALVVTDASLRELESFSDVRYFDIHVGSSGYVTDHVREMHTKNGLWVACNASIHDLHWIQGRLCAMLIGFEWEEGRPILAGSTPHFDRGFIRARMPAVDRLLHHRHFDVSTLKMAMRDNGYPDFGKQAEERITHRAMDDIIHSLDVARNFAQGIVGLAQG